MGQSNRHVSVLIFVRYVIRPVKRLELIHERVESLLCPDLDALLHPDSPVRSSLITSLFQTLYSQPFLDMPLRQNNPPWRNKTSSTKYHSFPGYSLEGA